MGFLDLVSGLFGPPATDVEITEEVRDLSDRASGNTITPALLAESADRTNEPLISYLESNEQPHFALRGTRLVLVDGDESQTRKHPTRLLVLLLTDARIVFVLGGRFGDDLFEVPLADVESIYVDEDGPQLFLVVEATKDGDPMTFFADVTLEAADEVYEGVEYVESRRQA